MRTFVLRARKSNISDRMEDQIGSNAHTEIIAHAIANAFFYSKGMRDDVEMYIVFDSSPDFPRTVHLIAQQGLSLPGFHEKAILSVISNALMAARSIVKDQTFSVSPGVEVMGFGFERLMQRLLENRTVYLLDKKGENIRNIEWENDAVFVLSDHLAMPKNSVKSLERRGLKKISLGKRVLFASQCIVLIQAELDRCS